ncbi:MAG: hypothetical protein EKK48_19045 [Candidatus Melainabacteria bacterium]|nr:MAG: hypothetical protein EKK48_19045 [Candidatus Melainabacteria bacterium]
MSELINSSLRRIATLTLVSYFVLPMVPGVVFSGDILSAARFGFMLFIATLGDLVEVALVLWVVSQISNGKFFFDFKMEAKSVLAPFFISALALAQVQHIGRKSAVLEFDGWLPMFESSLILALSVWVVCLTFDTLLFDLNVDRQGSRPRGGKRVRVTVPSCRQR